MTRTSRCPQIRPVEGTGLSLRHVIARLGDKINGGEPSEPIVAALVKCSEIDCNGTIAKVWSHLPTALTAKLRVDLIAANVVSASSRAMAAHASF